LRFGTDSARERERERMEYSYNNNNGEGLPPTAIPISEDDEEEEGGIKMARRVTTTNRGTGSLPTAVRINGLTNLAPNRAVHHIRTQPDSFLYPYTRARTHKQQAEIGRLTQITVLEYRKSIFFIAFLDAMLTLFNLFAGPYGMLGLITLPGPILGYIGAKTLNRSYVLIYLMFCFLKIVLGFITLLMSSRNSRIITIIIITIELFILKLVYTFHAIMGEADLDRVRRHLASDGPSESAAVSNN